MDKSIPKRIIQTEKNYDLPPLQKASATNLKLLNPDFEYMFFDDQQVEEFIMKEYPEYSVIFNSFKYPIQRYDFFRYLAVYRYGGFYFDLDVFLFEELEYLRNLSCVFPFEELTMSTFLRKQFGMDWEIGNYAFGATAGHPFLKAVIENCIRAFKDPEWIRPMMRAIPRIFRNEYYVLNSTGPGLVSRTLAEFPKAKDQIKVIFPEDVCDPECWHMFGKMGLHLQMGGWRKGNRKIIRRLAWIWEDSIRRKLNTESFMLGKTRSIENIKAMK